MSTVSPETTNADVISPPKYTANAESPHDEKIAIDRRRKPPRSRYRADQPSANESSPRKRISSRFDCFSCAGKYIELGWYTIAADPAASCSCAAAVRGASVNGYSSAAGSSWRNCHAVAFAG
ncbi:hypothetical protein LB505_012091 [Fusarium chuoi]|nr:hypothetical protein LB505_012091 [Fusarium chuoi]